jgi:hypothetical protein
MTLKFYGDFVIFFKHRQYIGQEQHTDSQLTPAIHKSKLTFMMMFNSLRMSVRYRFFDGYN